MSMIKCSSTFGNFSVALEAEVSEEQLAVLAGFGLLQLAQRSPASKAEKALAGYEKRPEGFKRESIAFSEANAKVLAGFMEDIKVEIGEKEQPLAVAATIAEYVPTAAETKWKEEKAKIASKGGDENKLRALAEAVGYDQPNAALLTVDNLEFCAAIRKWVREQVAGL